MEPSCPCQIVLVLTDFIVECVCFLSQVHEKANIFNCGERIERILSYGNLCSMQYWEDLSLVSLFIAQK